MTFVLIIGSTHFVIVAQPPLICQYPRHRHLLVVSVTSIISNKLRIVKAGRGRTIGRRGLRWSWCRRSQETRCWDDEVRRDIFSYGEGRHV